ncbi:hypothetical protein SLEP1_g39547 [Rubroshorea leprosula]|uniref:Uncharacterized protein n=1 Tax=Rubroshorea leprosula TaxID=152421 RepID=A0AAV5L0X7_9ROSI|nr:hypothetical protein SLEP1_g39547 [Rubroshorea leprosula]
MSSEGTMTVVRSEVMPLEYSGMDSKSSSSPSSSKRKVEERRERRVVEEDEEEIPSNIMEVEGNLGRCYDPKLDVVSEVKGYVSELSSGSSLRGLVNNYNLPHHVLIRLAGVNERACSAPRDHWMPMYVHYLFAGLRFPIPELLKAKKTKQNNYKLNEDEVEEVGKLVREEGELVDIMYLTSVETIKATELYGLSSLSEGFFLNTVGGLPIPKKPRKKSKTLTVVEKGATEKEWLSSTSARALEMQQRLEPMRRSSEEGGGGDRGARTWQRQGAHPSSFVPEKLIRCNQHHWAKRFLNATLPKVDRRLARDEAMSQLGAHVVRHSLECEELQKEKEELLKKNKEMQRKLDEVLPSVTELQNDNDTLSTRLVFEECKRKICEDKLKAQDKYIENMKKGVAELKKNVNLLVHNGMEEHIGNFLNSSTFENIINLYHLPTAILAFIDCRKKVKTQYPEVASRRSPLASKKKGWERDAEGRAIFPPAFDVELVAVGEEKEEAQGAGVENQANPAEAQPPVVHLISSDEV